LVGDDGVGVWVLSCEDVQVKDDEQGIVGVLEIYPCHRTAFGNSGRSIQAELWETGNGGN
jgi:hypothetical protein